MQKFCIIANRSEKLYVEVVGVKKKRQLFEEFLNTKRNMNSLKNEVILWIMCSVRWEGDFLVIESSTIDGRRVSFVLCV